MTLHLWFVCRYDWLEAEVEVVVVVVDVVVQVVMMVEVQWWRRDGGRGDGDGGFEKELVVMIVDTCSVSGGGAMTMVVR